MKRTLAGWVAGRGTHATRVPTQQRRGPSSSEADVRAQEFPDGVRPRTARDVPACARLLRVVAGEHQYPAHWPDAPRSWLTGPDVLDAWVCEQHGEILGHVAVATVPRNGMSRVRWQEITGLPVDELARVSRLFVRKRVRRQGIATDLLDVAVADIRRRGLHPVIDVVTTSADGIAFLERRGWRLLAMDPWGSASTERHKVHFYAAPSEDDEA
jgi:GNAT superfamily N-acetyltransferase